MGQVTVELKVFVSVKDGLFLVSNRDGNYVKKTKAGVENRYTASNGFEGYIDRIVKHTKQKEVVVNKKQVVIETNYWIVEMHDENQIYYSIWFDERSSTFFGLVNGLASIEQFGYLRLVSSQSMVTIEGKDTYFTHIWVKLLQRGVFMDIPRKFSKDEIPEPEVVYDSKGNPKITNGFPEKDYSKRIEFYAALIPIINEKIMRSNGEYTPYQLTETTDDDDDVSPDLLESVNTTTENKRLTVSSAEFVAPLLNPSEPTKVSREANESLFLEENDDVPF